MQKMTFLRTELKCSFPVILASDITNLGSGKIGKFKRNTQFWARSWPGGPFGRFKMQMANFGKGKTRKFKGEKAILGQILAEWPFWKAQKAKLKGNEAPKDLNEKK